MSTYKEANAKVRELKAKIKVLAGYQVFLKNQRKTIKLVGKREMEPSKAAYTHIGNRLTLRAMYMAYAIIRGKDKLDLIDSGNFECEYDKDWYDKKVAELVKQYYVEVVEEIIE